MQMDLCSVWLFYKNQQFVFMDKPQHFPPGVDCVRLQVEDYYGGPGEINSSSQGET